jgi:hypothetical protein
MKIISVFQRERKSKWSEKNKECKIGKKEKEV